MKATGAQIDAFFNNGWPGDDWYWDYAEIEVENEQGDFILDLEQEYDLAKFGYLCYQGSEQCDDMEFAEAFQKWYNDIKYIIYAVSIPKDKTKDFLNFVASIDGQVK